ncbi:MAG: PRC-barrel domain-containing protein [Acidimicrobiales bacterium]
MDTFTNVERRPVIAADSAESIGSVQGFVLDVGGRQIEAIHVDGRGKRANLLPWASVSAFGADAVMAAPGATASTVELDHQKAAVSGDVSLIGARVLSVDGRERGTVTDAEFDTATGAILRAITDEGPVEANRFRSLGSYALVVSDPGPGEQRTTEQTGREPAPERR